MSTDSQWRVLTFSAQNQCIGEACMDRFSPVARSTTPARVSSISVDTKIRVFPSFSNTLLLQQDDRTDVQGKESIFRPKQMHARNFFKVYSSRPPKTFRPNISKTTSPSLYITYMYIIHKNMKNKSYYGFETKKGPFSFSIITALRLGIFRRTWRQ